MKFINVPELIRRHDFVRVGLMVVEDNYRDWQGHIRDIGKHDTGRVRNGYYGALEVVRRQCVELLGLDAENVEVSLKGHLHNRCGMPDNPRGFDEWNQPDVHTYAVLT